MGPRTFSSHGDGRIDRRRFRRIGRQVVFERGAMVFHPENIVLGENVYVGHYAILKAYHRNTMEIGSGTWIGQMAFLHSAGGIVVGRDVGIGPRVTILTSAHELRDRGLPILNQDLSFAPVELGDGCDIGAGATLLPGVRVGKGAQVGAGSVVTRNVPAYAVVSGVPARRRRLWP